MAITLLCKICLSIGLEFANAATTQDGRLALYASLRWKGAYRVTFGIYPLKYGKSPTA